MAQKEKKKEKEKGKTSKHMVKVQQIELKMIQKAREDV